MSFKVEKKTKKKGLEKLVVILHGLPGIGKSTTAIKTSDKTLVFDFEEGTSFIQGDYDVVTMKPEKGWFTDKELIEFEDAINDKKYKTIVIDSITQAMEFLIEDKTAVCGVNIRNQEGELTQNGWGEVKRRFKRFLKMVKDSKKDVIFIAHTKKVQNENNVVLKNVNIATKLADEIQYSVDAVLYMDKDPNDSTKRVIIGGDPSGIAEAKDRTGKLGGNVPADWNSIKDMVFSEGQ